MRSALLALLAFAAAAPARGQGPQLPPEESFVRTAHAARRVGSPIVVDGKMDEPAWQAAPLEDNFTQVAPDEGKPASVHTAFRVLWDDEYLYFGAVCDDPNPPTISLSRRDRFIEGDTIQFDLDTTLDRRTAYHFQVYAAGQQLDAIHFNDTDMTTDWDAAWDSAVAKTPTGWSVEMRIPLRSLRIPEAAKVMGFNVYRLLSRRKEEDQWRFRPNGRAGDISRLGLIDGIEGIHPVRELELRPYLGAKYLRTLPTYAKGHPELGSCATTFFDADRGGGLCAGLDLRYNLASDLALVGTLNPDFGQVEADQRILNLSTFETFFPEKRPFFLEGLDLFKLPYRVDIGGPYGGDAYQLFYSRRIGRGSPTSDDLNLGSDQHLVFEQPSVPVVSAMKVSGTIGGASVGLLSAVEPRVSAQVLTPDPDHPANAPIIKDFRAVEARNDAVLRVRKMFGDNTMVGFSGTSVDPLFSDGALVPQRHAHVGEGDLTLYTNDRAWDFTVQGLGSHLTGNT
ncbi:MAG: carbohydrate binding family 9 domain-containing protein, partial [Myxococcales bacterium]|nr:carbohydrate binding family 9 domain-containing protein [Myxococcales bacterium]